MWNLHADGVQGEQTTPPQNVTLGHMDYFE